MRYNGLSCDNKNKSGMHTRTATTMRYFRRETLSRVIHPLVEFTLNMARCSTYATSQKGEVCLSE
jgi:hypothetical protein